MKFLFLFPLLVLFAPGQKIDTYGAWSRVVIQMPEDISASIGNITPDNFFDLPSELSANGCTIKASIDGKPLPLIDYTANTQRLTALTPKDLRRSPPRRPHIITVEYSSIYGRSKTFTLPIYCTTHSTDPAWAYIGNSHQPVAIVQSKSRPLAILHIGEPLVIEPEQFIQLWCYGVLVNTPARNSIKVTFSNSTQVVSLNAYASPQAIQGLCSVTVETVPELRGMGLVQVVIETPDGISEIGTLVIQ